MMRRPSLVYVVVPAILGAHVGALAWSASQHSPVANEMGHLASGMAHWRFGRFEFFRVNPPLVRLVATAPAVMVGPEPQFSRFVRSPSRRPEFCMGRQLLEANPGVWLSWLVLARWTCIPLSMLGGYICFRWASELHGQTAGIFALILWCFSPNILAHGQLITPDAGAAALGVAAAYVFWRWLKRPTWGRVLVAGLLLGLAELTKTTWIVLFGLWPLLWIVWRWPEHRKLAWPAWHGQAWQMVVILLLALYLINLGFGFERSFQRLGDYRFVSQTLGGYEDATGRRGAGRNRFAGTWLGQVPVPLPEDYLRGIDVQKWDFERKKWSCLRCAWRMGGWWYYYLYALAIKVPLGTWVLVILAVVVGLFFKGYSASRRDEVVLSAPLIVVLTLVSSQTGFNHHLRYVLLIFPFVFIWASKVARAVQFGHHKIATVAAVALFWSVGSSLCVYPHSLSYFNELVGGPTGGHDHLGGVTPDSNIDWGQDLLYLKRWLDDHPKAQPLHLAFNGGYDASTAGIEYTPPLADPQPGWHALSVNRIRSRSGEYKYFLQFEPVAMAGYSIYVYHITLEDANGVRREMGLPPLPEDSGT